MKESSLRDVLAGIGTAILAAAVMLLAALIPLLLLTFIIKQRAGLIAAGVIVAAGAFAVGVRWICGRQHHYAQRRH